MKHLLGVVRQFVSFSVLQSTSSLTDREEFEVLFDWSMELVSLDLSRHDSKWVPK